MTIHGADSRGLPAPVATTVGASRRERGHWAWISSLTIASLGGLNFLPCAVLWILLLSAPEGEGGGILFVALIDPVAERDSGPLRRGNRPGGRGNRLTAADDMASRHRLGPERGAPRRICADVRNRMGLLALSESHRDDRPHSCDGGPEGKLLLATPG